MVIKSRNKNYKFLLYLDFEKNKCARIFDSRSFYQVRRQNMNDYFAVLDDNDKNNNITTVVTTTTATTTTTTTTATATTTTTTTATAAAATTT
jgi:gluconate kinase